jgi:hypothetical protein
MSEVTQHFIMTEENPQTREHEILIELTDLLPGTSRLNRDKTAEAFLELVCAIQTPEAHIESLGVHSLLSVRSVSSSLKL